MSDRAPPDPPAACSAPTAGRQPGQNVQPSGRELYDQARARARARPPADPQSNVMGGPGAPAGVARMMRPCLTVLPDRSFCGHTGFEHDIGTRGGKPARTGCSVVTAAGPCGCREYKPGAA